MLQADSEHSPLPRILVVDDSRIVRATIKKHLGASYEVIEEPNGEAGWQRLIADESIQLLISDLTMPVLDGLGLLSRVRGPVMAVCIYYPLLLYRAKKMMPLNKNAWNVAQPIL